MPDLLARRKADLEEQFHALPRELEHWKSLTGTPPYDKHHSQISDSDLSAWALSREQEFEPQDDKTGATRGALFVNALSAMPIAVLGIPWYTSELLLNLATLAHETGHVVDSDFGIGETLQSIVATTLQTSPLRDGWSIHWRREVFADLFACYAAGLLDGQRERTRTGAGVPLRTDELAQLMFSGRNTTAAQRQQPQP